MEPGQVPAVIDSRSPASSRAMAKHFMRIQALTRRLGEPDQDEYEHLQPATDLLGFLQEHLGTIIESRLVWDPIEPEAGADRTAAIRRHVFAAFHDLVQQRLITRARARWRDALRRHSGKGSARRRAEDVATILEKAFPVDDEPGASELREVCWNLIENAITQTAPPIAARLAN